MKQDKLARRLAASALALALVAVMLGAYAVNMGNQYLEDVRTLGQAMEQGRQSGALGAPPLTLETE